MSGDWDSAADWSDGAGDDDRPSRPRTPLPTQGARRLVEVVACPHCASPLATRADSHAGDAMARWECRDCGGSWKELARVGTDGRRVYLA